MFNTGPISFETTVHILNLKVMNFFNILLCWVLLFALWPCKDCKYMQVMLHWNLLVSNYPALSNYKWPLQFYDICKQMIGTGHGTLKSLGPGHWLVWQTCILELKRIWLNQNATVFLGLPFIHAFMLLSPLFMHSFDCFKCFSNDTEHCWYHGLPSRRGPLTTWWT